MNKVPSDIEIAQSATMKPIAEIAEKYGVLDDELELYGKYKAKISLDAFKRLKDTPNGKLVLVTAISPTPAGEGKSTTSIGLGQALNKIGKKAFIALREPSLGPVFGIKGGAAGGGHVPQLRQHAGRRRAFCDRSRACCRSSERYSGAHPQCEYRKADRGKGADARQRGDLSWRCLH